MVARLFYILLFVFLSLESFSQQDVHVIGTFDGGIPFFTSNNSSILKAKLPAFQAQYLLSVQYKISRLGIEAGIGQSYQGTRFIDKTFKSANPGFKEKITFNNHYFTCFGALKYYQPLDDYKSLYFSAGYSLNLVGTKTSHTTAYLASKSDGIDMTATYLGQNNSIYGEFGYQIQNNKNFFSIGLKMSVGRSALMNGTYTITDPSSTVLEQATYSSTGTFVGFNMKYGIQVAHKERKPKVEKTPKEKPVHNHVAKVKKPKTPKTPKIDSTVVVKKDTVKTPPSDSIPKQIDGRTVNVTHQIAVTNRTITIKVWDDAIVDGDIISLNFNGNWILENYTLEKQQKVITVQLQPGTNYLVLHALNLGKYTPNTAAILVDDGGKETKVVLSSTLNESGTIEINLQQ